MVMTGIHFLFTILRNMLSPFGLNSGYGRFLAGQWGGMTEFVVDNAMYN